MPPPKYQAVSVLPAEVDVVVIGGGNAAMSAALAARHNGATVLVLEASPRHFRGGNSRHTRDVRYMHEKIGKYVTGVYPEAEFHEDLRKVTAGTMDEELTRLVLRESEDIVDWMEEQGVDWQQPLRGTLHLSRTNVFMLGGGTAMMNGYYATAERIGVDVAYDAHVDDMKIEAGRVTEVHVTFDGGTHIVKPKGVVVAAGGFEANIEWLKEYWSDAADNFIIRGTPYNKGKLLAILLELGAQPVADPTQAHMVAVDGRAPKFDGGIVTRLDSVPFGIAVNQEGQRFYDEGEDFWPKRYAIWGRLIAQQPGQVAYSIVDSKVIDSFMPSVFAPVEANSIPEIATKLGIDPVAVQKTIDEFNAAVQTGTFDPAELDDCVTHGLTPEKTHWAQRIEKPPFYAYPLRPGITFTYRGVKVNDKAKVIQQDEQEFTNIWAAGEVMAGNILGQGYLAGFGLTIGAVFGRIAGREAAKYARA